MQSKQRWIWKSCHLSLENQKKKKGSSCQETDKGSIGCESQTLVTRWRELQKCLDICDRKPAKMLLDMLAETFLIGCLLLFQLIRVAFWNYMLKYSTTTCLHYQIMFVFPPCHQLVGLFVCVKKKEVIILFFIIRK